MEMKIICENTCEYECGTSLINESPLLASEVFHAICHALFICDVAAPVCAFSTWTDVGKRVCPVGTHIGSRVKVKGQLDTRGPTGGSSPVDVQCVIF